MPASSSARAKRPLSESSSSLAEPRAKKARKAAKQNQDDEKEVGRQSQADNDSEATRQAQQARLAQAREAVKERPGDHEALFRLARSLHECGESRDGLQVLLQAKETMKTNFATMEELMQATTSLYGPPISRLPSELLLCIFKYGFSESLLCVCKSWKTLIEEETSLWRDARFPDLPAKRRMGLVVRCATITSHALTHVDMSGIETVKQAKAFLGLCLQSQSTLHHLTYDDRPLTLKVKSNKSQLDAIGKLARQLLGSAPQLGSVTVRIHEDTLLSMDEFSPATPAGAQGPAKVCIEGPNGPWKQLDRERLIAIFDHLTRDVRHLEYQINCDRYFLEWAEWARSCLLEHSEQFLSCKVRSSSEKLFKISLIRLSALQTGTFYTTCKAPDPALEAPSLRALSANCTLAARIRAPELRAASLMVERKSDVSEVRHLLTNCPLIENLTLTLQQVRLQRGGDDAWKSQLLDLIVGTLIPKRNQEVVGRNLRQLKLVVHERSPCRDLTPTQLLDTRHFANPGPQAQTPRFSKYEMSLTEFQGRAFTGGQLIDLLEQRRRLSEGLRPVPLPRYSRLPKRDLKAEWGECCALETIQLIGVGMEACIWETLLEDSTATVSSYPYPDGEKQRSVGGWYH